MISSGKVSGDASSIGEIFSSYSSSISNLDSDSVWEGKSKQNAISQTKKFVSDFSPKIKSQMTDFASAIDKYEEYKQLKKDIEDEKTAKSNAKLNDPEADLTSYDTNISRMEREKDNKKREIERLLSNVESKKLDIQTAQIELESYTLGNFVNYYQGDYRNVSYGFGTTIASAGCGPTSMAMVLSYLTGETVDPPKAASYSLKHGYRWEGQGTAWEYFPAISKEYGINCESYSPSASKIRSELASGKTMIMSMGPGNFTRGGHYIVLKGITSDGKIIVADPASRDRSSQVWSADLIASQAKNMWSFDAGPQTVTVEI